jgi:hypothetical protein
LILDGRAPKARCAEIVGSLGVRKAGLPPLLEKE